LDINIARDDPTTCLRDEGEFISIKRIFSKTGGGMIAPDGREIVFAGAGILWGATTFFRGLRVWRADKPAPVSVGALVKSPVAPTLIVGFVLTLACSAYLAYSLLEYRH
jgi:hypothetical protein